MKVFADNRRARRDYSVGETFVAGVSLQGWEVKAVRAGKAQIGESYAVFSRGELFLLNSRIAPLQAASSHIDPDPARSRKLLLTAKEIAYLGGKVREKGMTLLPLNLHLSRGKIKTLVGLARGRKKYDKRAALKSREWKREREKLLKGNR